MSTKNSYMRILPHDIEAEQSVIGACLIDKGSVISSIEVLQKDDFYREDNKIIFECISSLFSQNKPVDIITLKDELSSIGKLDAVGGLEYIAYLPERVPTTANVEQYINIIKEKSTTRKLINMANEIANLGFESTTNTQELTELAERRIFEIAQNKDTKGVSKLKDLLVASINNLEDVYNNGMKKGIPTGFTNIDRRMGGLRGSELIILAARPRYG